MSAFRFIDLFAGIGGLRLAFENASCECVFSSEIDKFAVKTYTHMFADKPHHAPVGDIRAISAIAIPQHDILVGGFPCQPFSQAGIGVYHFLGRNHGFQDPKRGRLFLRLSVFYAFTGPKPSFWRMSKSLKLMTKGEPLQ